MESKKCGSESLCGCVVGTKDREGVLARRKGMYLYVGEVHTAGVEGGYILLIGGGGTRVSERVREIYVVINL